MEDTLKSIIVIGASAGGLQAVAELATHLDIHLDTAVFVVLHVSTKSVGRVLVHHIQKSTSFICMLAEDNLPIQKGHLYVAPPDHHLMLKQGIMRVHKGPHENRWRPSIDVLFRSAAATYDSHVIGIILTGLMDDGTSGMSAIKRSGGVCIVQEPSEAEYADMPLNVLENVKVDHRIPISEIGYVLQDIFAKPRNVQVPIPEEVKLEAAITERIIATIEEVEKLGTKSDYACPDCGGGLWEIKEGQLYRYRCYNGHAYTEKSLMHKHSDALEESLWISIRMLEERKNLLTRISHHEREKGNQIAADANLKQAEETNQHAQRLKQLLININKTGPDEQGFS